jgi:prepilin-type N-terminal cleavage/methylation domain-containing protein
MHSMRDRSKHSSPDISSRRGMTLLELMLVLALLVVVGAMAMPALKGPFANQRLRKAGEMIRVEWNRARIQAMKTGQIQMFRYETDGKVFYVQPYLTEQDYLEADAMESTARDPSMAAQATGTSGAAMPGAAASVQPQLRQRELPDGVIFAGGYFESDSRSAQIQQESQAALMAAGNQVAPILFYPDGTTSDAELILSNDQQLFVRVTLRSLTGIAKVSDLMNANELPSRY